MQDCDLVKGHSLSSTQRYFGLLVFDDSADLYTFTREGLAGLIDRREDNGDTKITKEHEAFL